MQYVYIVGGNGFARECYLYLSWMASANPNTIQFGGFLGHNGYGHTVDYKELQYFYRGELSYFHFRPDEVAVIGAGMPELRSKIYAELMARNIPLFNIVAPYVYINPTVFLGSGNVFVSPFSPGPNVKIGNGNVFNGGVVVGHDVEIGDCNFFGGHSHLLGGVHIGSYNSIGTASVILPKATIGNFNKIAPMSCVYKGCKDYCYMHGNPALKIGDIEGAIDINEQY